MNAEKFVEAFYTEKQGFLKEYLYEKSETEVSQLIKSMDLNDKQKETLEKMLDLSFTDIFYTILLGLDGCASIGGVQEMYDLKGEKGNQISGEIEGHAFEYFSR